MPLTHILVDFDNVKPSAADIALAHGDSMRLAIVRGPQKTKYEAELAETLHAMGSRVSFSRCIKAGKNAADMQIAYHLGEIVAALTSGMQGTRFVVISRDRGFEPLLAYLRGKGFDATQAPNFKSAFPEVSTPATKAAPKAATKVAKKGAAKKAAAKIEAPAKATSAKSAKKAAKKKVEAARSETGSARKNAQASPAAAAAPAAEAIERVIASLQRMGEKRPNKRKGLTRHIESHLGRKHTPEQVEALVDRLAYDGLLAFDGNKVEYRLPKKR
jgi:hypothetical protein